MIIPSNIEWHRMAVPQDDGYDTDILLSLRPLPQRTKGEGGIVRLCDGDVLASPGWEGGLPNPAVKPAPTDHPNLSAALLLVSRWTTVYRQFRRLIDIVHPYSDEKQAQMGRLALGSSSHSRDSEFGAIHVTVDSTIGCAQALVHEMAHHKLRALGVYIESAAQLVINPSSHRFVSPIRKEKTRPMTAVFHAQYSFMHVTALDLHMLDASADDRERTYILMLLARNVPRMQTGFTEIERNIQTDAAGELFIAAFMAWSREILDRGQAALDIGGYGTV
jgi:HEXXH motif-containing protein